MILDLRNSFKHFITNDLKNTDTFKFTLQVQMDPKVENSIEGSKL